MKENEQNGESYTMTKLPETGHAIPCGLHAISFFNDNYRLTRIEENGSEEILEIDETGIAWANDVKNQFKNVKE